ncbi:nicotinamide riboside transporter PnuC [Xanthomonas graminis]|jgi:nicotinamide mononucleotide transporter|uniref:nicotinamide riboside transporter PnuC n=1 Tax=Xanthomonas graminis TaxID=3390026 RepID=UPI00029CA690|nr:nicotinamide riboside transporter PnuC [Xanthomonas translucens]EKU26484.1 Putative nicotinamide mononucleotide uptake permease [Xanthomonas translucens pv. graminis ART-Xtg29]OAX62817.1 aminotransferase [Xanthomonas translucens pv. graminis]UKE53929.1 nicotinamide riboside transporter PnuC [Xanthomonas translucens pv. graminis]WIH09442.1 nicotinamide riboside transporter PnuC [Xanthomonas translucens pv. graminis]WIH13002.1 nicotinamide riboside transporter PnuC [Xanthomonas translucens pv
MSPLELLAVLVNLLGVWLTARRVRWCWPVNVVAVLLYAWLFYQWKLYSDMLLQGVYVVLQGYGWWRWSQGRLDHGKVQVGPLPRREGVLSLLAGAAGALSLGWLMHRHTDAALPWLDAALSAFSLVASVWAARKRIANWTLWIVLDSLYVGVFVYKGLYPTAALYAGFVLLAIYGLRLWQAQQRGAAGAAP